MLCTPSNIGRFHSQKERSLSSTGQCTTGGFLYQTFCPDHQFYPSDRGGKPLSGQNYRTGNLSNPGWSLFADIASTGCSKQDNLLPCEIICIQETIYNGRFPIPPDRIANKNHISRCNRCSSIQQLRPAGLVIHLDRRPALLVCPVQIHPGIRCLRTDFIQFSTDCFRQFLCHFGSYAAG